MRFLIRRLTVTHLDYFSILSFHVAYMFLLIEFLQFFIGIVIEPFKHLKNDLSPLGWKLLLQS